VSRRDRAWAEGVFAPLRRDLRGLRRTISKVIGLDVNLRLSGLC